MVRDEDIKRYSNMEAPELRLRCVVLDTENSIFKVQLDSLRRERNVLLKKVADVDFNVGDNRPSQQQSNAGLPPIPRLNPRPNQ